LHTTGTVSQDVIDGPNKFVAAWMCTARYLVKLNKSDISYLKNKPAFDVLIHSRALLAAILCWLATLWASRVAARFWHFCFQSASCHCVYVACTSQYPSQTHNCARHSRYTKQLSKLPKSTIKVRLHENNLRDTIIVDTQIDMHRYRRRIIFRTSWLRASHVSSR